MKEKILELRSQGKSYKTICKELGCSLGTVAYHCGDGQKDKYKERLRELRKSSVVLKKTQNFKSKVVRSKADDFQRRDEKGKLTKRDITFNYKDVIDRFGWKTKCYLTGTDIDLRETKTYEFDHIVPVSKGGSNTLDNLGIVCKEGNKSKSDMFLDDYLALCKKVLEHNGYKVIKPEEGCSG